MKKSALVIIILINIIFSVKGECFALHDYWLKSVVLIEQENKNERGELQVLPIASGFLLQSERGYFYIVTCKHVVMNKDGSAKPGLFYRLNTKSPVKEPFDRIPIGSIFKEAQGGYFLHPNENVDIAIFPVLVNIQRDDVEFITLNKFDGFDQINLGEEIFVLGHPNGTVSGTKNIPIVRDGIVSLKNSDLTFLIDSTIFPGDSGGPVITKNLPFSYNKGALNFKEGTPSQLIGMVSQQIRYTEPAISPQTGNIRIMFEENSGLSTVVSSDFIKDILDSEALRQYEGQAGQENKEIK